MSKKVMKAVQIISLALLVIGGLILGIEGVLKVDVVWTLLNLTSLGSIASSVVYILIGVAALAVIVGSLLMKKKK